MLDPPAFDGFPPATFSWFAGLESDNSKGWFAAHRETYDSAVRGALEALLEQLAGELGGTVKLFRQHRDTRFSADKSPYKTTTYGLIALERAIAAAHQAGVETFGEALKTAPRGFARDHPRVGLLCHKALVGGRRLDPGAGGIAATDALEHARATWAACGPLNAWLDEHVGPSEIPAPPRPGRAAARAE